MVKGAKKKKLRGKGKKQLKAEKTANQVVRFESDELGTVIDANEVDHINMMLSG